MIRAPAPRTWFSDNVAAPFTIRLESQAAAEDERCIASIAYPGDFAGAARGPVVATGLSPLDDDRRCQNWYAKDPVRRAREGPLCYAFNDELLFGHVHVSPAMRNWNPKPVRPTARCCACSTVTAWRR